MRKKVVAFDLDDTLYKEIDFLKSGYRKVAELVARQCGCDARAIYDQLLKWYYNGENAFACMNEEYGFGNSINEYLDIYKLITNNPIDINDIVKRANIDLKTAMSKLTMLELEGKIKNRNQIKTSKKN